MTTYNPAVYLEPALPAWACGAGGYRHSSLALPDEDWLREVLSLAPELLEGRCTEESSGVAIVAEDMRYLILCRFGEPWLVLRQQLLPDAAVRA